jgi:hypothetical protein
VCRHFDIIGLLLNGQGFKTSLPRDWYLGSLKDVSQRRYCPLFRLICSIAKQNLSSNDILGLSRAMLSLWRHEVPIKALEVRLSCRDPFGWEAAVQFQWHPQIFFAEEGAHSLTRRRWLRRAACHCATQGVSEFTAHRPLRDF